MSCIWLIRAKKCWRECEGFKPYEQRELMQLMLQRTEVNQQGITLEVFALNEASIPEKMGAEGDVVRMRPVWLPGG